MALDKIISTVFTVFKADTKEHKRKLKDLSGEEKKRHKALVDGMDAQNEKIDNQMKSLIKMAGAVAAVGAAYLTLRDGAETYLEEVNARHATAGLELDKLREATKGLISDQDLLKLSAAAMNSDFKITQKQLQDVGRQIIELRNQNNDLTEVTEEYSKALAEGNVEGLKKFGKVIQDVQPGIEAHTALLRDAADVTDVASLAGDEFIAANIGIENTLRDLRVEIGRFVVQVSPMIAKLKDLVKWGTEVVRILTFDGGDKTAAKINTLLDRRTKLEKLRKKSLRGASGPVFSDYDNDISKINAEIAKLRADKNKRLNSLLQSQNRGAMQGAALPSDLVGESGEFRKGRGLGSGPNQNYNPVSGFGAFDASGVSGSGIGDPSFGLGEDSLGGLGLQMGSDAIARIKGEELEMLQKRMEMLQPVVDRFAGAMQTAFMSIATGAKSMSEAVKEAFGNMVLASAGELFGIGVSSSVKAVVALATPGGQKAAAGYAAGAAKAFLGAAALTTLAYKMGATGQAAPTDDIPSGGAPTPPSSRFGRDDRDDRGGKTVVLLGSGLDFAQKRERATALRDLLKANRESFGDDETVSF